MASPVHSLLTRGGCGPALGAPRGPSLPERMAVREGLVGELRRPMPEELLAAERLPRLVELLPCRVLRGLLLVELVRGLQRSPHDLVGEGVELYPVLDQPLERRQVLEIVLGHHVGVRLVREIG